ncbi:hypothetical protein N7532_007069 [Penicillium argentinense]|uniref:Uncharacterized protein n=1 Tax=Penicillium argentinense TaxID=1131581 RepID=A0A9W9FH67_9EURO|nr:uncharacterized protein N7532_007069 [Penicillium argentinense]KAJ5100068.1 hypothetical protein N7532_007069 [Penicillium argentinense]
MLDRDDVRLLTQILHLDNTGVMQIDHKPLIARLIENLPKRLRRARPRSFGLKKPAREICEVHSQLNGELIEHIFIFVQREVTVHLRLFEDNPDLCHPVEDYIVTRLRGMRAMWTKPSPEIPTIPFAWPYQINECPACMLARVASDIAAVHYLRVMVLSRTRTRRNHRPRTLMPFIDECINQLGGNITEEIYNTSSQLAFGMKAARKACVKSELRKRGFDSHRQSKRRRRHRSNSEARTRACPKVETPKNSSMKILEHEAVMISATSLSTVDIWGDDHSDCQPQQKAISPDIGGSNRDSDLNQETHDPPENIRESEDWNSIQLGRDAVDELIEMYRTMGQKHPYSRGTSVPEAMVQPLDPSEEQEPSHRPRNAPMYHRDTWVMKYRTAEELAALSQQYAQLPLSALLPPPEGFPKEDMSMKNRSVPFENRYSPSDYANTDWEDDYCTESELDLIDSAANNDSVPAAETTWDLVCDHHNVI